LTRTLPARSNTKRDAWLGGGGGASVESPGEGEEEGGGMPEPWAAHTSLHMRQSHLPDLAGCQQAERTRCNLKFSIDAVGWLGVT